MSELEGGPPKKKRRSKWDIPAPDSIPTPSQAPPTTTPTDPSSAAAAAAAKLNAMLAAQGKLVTPAVPPLLPPKPSVVPPSSNLAPISRPAPGTSDSGAIALEIDINDLDIRGHLTKGPTLSELNRTTGAFVSVRGRFFPPGDRPRGPGDRPLHLHIQASSQDKVNVAVHRINDIITSSGHPGRVPRAPPPGPAPHVSIASLFPGAGNLPGGMHYVQDKAFVGLEQAPEAFKLLEKLQGPGGAFLSHIATQTGAKVHLRGRGSGFIEPTSGKESFEALYIYISHSNSEGLGASRKLCENLIDTVRQEYEGWRRSQQPLGFGGFAPHYGPPPPRHPGYRGPYQQPPYGPPLPGYGAPPPGYQPQGHMLPHGPRAPPHGYGGAPPPGPEGPPPGHGGPPSSGPGAPPPGPSGAPPPGYGGAPPPGGSPNVPPYNYYPQGGYYAPQGGFGGYGPPPANYQQPLPAPEQQPPQGSYPPPHHPAPSQQPHPQPHPQSGQHWHPDAQLHPPPVPPSKRRFTEQVEAPPPGKGPSATYTEMQAPPLPQRIDNVPTPPSATEDHSLQQDTPDTYPLRRFTEVTPTETPVEAIVTPPEVAMAIPTPLSSAQESSGPKWKPLTSPPITSMLPPSMLPPSNPPAKGPKNSQLMPPPSLPAGVGGRGLKVTSQESSLPPPVTSETSKTQSKMQLVSLVAYADDSDSDSDV